MAFWDGRNLQQYRFACDALDDTCCRNLQIWKLILKSTYKYRMLAAGTFMCLLLSASAILIIQNKGGRGNPAEIFLSNSASSKTINAKHPAQEGEDPTVEITGFRKPAAATFNLESLLTLSRSDVRAANELVSFVKLCRTALGNEYTGARTARFQDPRWRQWVQSCDWNTLSELMDDMGNWAKPQSQAWDELEALALPNTGLAELAERDAIASRIIEESDDPELVAQAAYVYFDNERLRAWAAADLPHSMRQHDVSDLSADLSLLLACQLGKDCSATAVSVLSECATTAMCYPGLSMEEVIALRRSPQDMILMRSYVQQVLKRRHGK